MDGLFNSFWIYVPEAYLVGARLLEHVARTNPCSLTGHIVQFRIRKVPRRAWELRGNERSDQLGLASSAAHECFQKRIEKGETVPDDYLLRRANF